MKDLFIMMGVPGSGKSTFVDKYMKGAVHVSRDEIRFSLLKEGDKYFDREKEVFEIFYKTINRVLESSHMVVADATHLNPQSRNKLLSRLRYDKNKVRVNIIYMATPLETCLQRNETRRGTKAYVPPHNLIEMYENLREPNFEECFGAIDVIYKVTPERVERITRG